MLGAQKKDLGAKWLEVFQSICSRCCTSCAQSIPHLVRRILTRLPVTIDIVGLASVDVVRHLARRDTGTFGGQGTFAQFADLADTESALANESIQG